MGAGSPAGGCCAGGDPGTPGSCAGGDSAGPGRCQGLGAVDGGAVDSGADAPVSWEIGCEKMRRLGEGLTGGVGGPTLSQRRKNMIICRYSFPVK